MIITNLVAAAEIQLKTKETKPTVKKTMKLTTKIKKWKQFQTRPVSTMMT
jgi:hypothetical protein